jgi:hypothetical protein
MNELEVFLNVVKNNSSVKKTLALSEEYLTNLSNVAASCSNKTWDVATPISGIWESYRDNSFTVVSNKRDGTVNRPTKMVMYNNGFLVSNRYSQLSFFDSNWSFINYFGRYADPRSGDNYYADVTGFALDEVNGRIYLACSNYHIVRCFTFPEMEYVFTIGDGTSGNIADNRLYNPDDVVLLSNGNILVSSSYGYGEIDGVTGTIRGNITEFSGIDGSVVNTRIMGDQTNNGDSWLGGVYRPGSMTLKDGLLYVAIRGKDNIGVWDTETWKYVKAYNKPTGWDVDSVMPRGIAVTDAEVIICAESPGVVVGLGKDDNDYKWSVGRKAWDDKKKANNYPGDFYQPFHVMELTSELIAVLDYGNNRIQVVPKNHYVDVPYNLPVINGYEIVEDSLPEEFHLENSTLETPLPKLSLIKPLIIAYKKTI